MQHPEVLGDDHIAQFLSFLALQRHVSVSTQKQALSALVFLYKNVLHRQKVNLPSWSHAKRPRRLPTVFSILEANLILDQLHGSPKLAALLMYGAGFMIIMVIKPSLRNVVLGLLYISTAKSAESIEASRMDLVFPLRNFNLLS